MGTISRTVTDALLVLWHNMQFLNSVTLEMILLDLVKSKATTCLDPFYRYMKGR